MSERASKVSRLPREEVEQRLEITSSPQFHDQASTPRIMWSVTACLVPASAWGVYVFGWYALAVLLVSVLASVATEWIIARAMSRRTLFDGSAVLTGILIGMNMPPEIPFHVPIVASIFAIGVVKWTFGGLGNNWMNPALAGACLRLLLLDGGDDELEDALHASGSGRHLGCNSPRRAEVRRCFGWRRHRPAGRISATDQLPAQRYRRECHQLAQ